MVLSEERPLSRDERFITWLIGLAEDGQERSGKNSAKNRAILAALRRGLGKTPGGVLEMYPHLMQFLKPTEEQLLENFALIASLFAMHPDKGGKGNLGSTLAEVRKAAELSGAGASSIERRFVALLNAHREDLPKHLRQVISLAKSRDVSIDWLQLLHDIRYWNNPDRIVQRRWAREFWAGFEPSSEDANGDGNPVNEEEENAL